jgi:hypothetical protein
MAKALTGRTKETHGYLQDKSKRVRAFSDEQEQRIVDLFVVNNWSFIKIHRYLISEGYKISYTGMDALIRRRVSPKQKCNRALKNEQD